MAWKGSRDPEDISVSHQKAGEHLGHDQVITVTKTKELQSTLREGDSRLAGFPVHRSKTIFVILSVSHWCLWPSKPPMRKTKPLLASL